MHRAQMNSDSMSSLIINYRLTIAYDGTAYQGWQVQPNGCAIQEQIQKALQTALKKEITLIGSGRTDTGVHAKGQIAHFKYALENNDQELDLYRLLASLNGILPRDIRVKKIEKVPHHFHAQHSAISKVYHYHLWLDPVQDPSKRLYNWHVHKKIDRELLIKAAELFVGTHDFTSFANEAHRGSAAKDPVRTIMRLDVIEQEGGLRLEFEADGFLYKMVRNIVGMLIEVACCNCSLEDVPKAFSAKDRKIAPSAAPAQGLFLMEVKYKE